MPLPGLKYAFFLLLRKMIVTIQPKEQYRHIWITLIITFTTTKVCFLSASPNNHCNNITERAIWQSHIFATFILWRDMTNAGEKLKAVVRPFQRGNYNNRGTISKRLFFMVRSLPLIYHPRRLSLFCNKTVLLIHYELVRRKVKIAA